MPGRPDSRLSLHLFGLVISAASGSDTDDDEKKEKEQSYDVEKVRKN